MMSEAARNQRRAAEGYRVIAFARDVLRQPLDPWQQWLVIHLLPDGRPRRGQERA